MKLIEEPYHVPDGYQDFPFAYVFQPSSLTTGNNYLDIQVALQGDSDFILRRITGVTSVVDTSANGGRWNYKNPSRQYANGNPTTGIVAFKNWPVVPEKLFKYNEAIWIDLYDVNVSTNICGGTPIPWGCIAFFGVKRFARGQGYPLQTTTYKYKEMPQRYELSLTISQPAFAAGTTSPNPPQRIVQVMDNYDFELLRIQVGQQGSTGTLLTQDFAVTLYDRNMHQTSNNPLPQGFINAGQSSPSAKPPYQALWPVPSLVYPAGSSITLDITSLLCTPALPQTYDISLEGIWRLPC